MVEQEGKRDWEKKKRIHEARAEFEKNGSEIQIPDESVNLKITARIKWLTRDYPEAFA